MASSSPPPPQQQIQIITPNSTNQTPLHRITIFLAGPTDTPWRPDFLALLLGQQRELHLPGGGGGGGGLTVYDPVQPAWDSTWREDYYARDPRFRAQVDWELDRQDAASLVVFFFPATGPLAPVSLLELGLCARSGKAVVACQEGYWKRGNVQAVCKRWGLPLEESLEGLVGRVVATVTQVQQS